MPSLIAALQRRFDSVTPQGKASGWTRGFEVKAIEDCTVEGRTQTNNTPDHSDRGSACGAASHRPNPSNGNSMKVAEVIAACSRQCSAPRDQRRARKPRPPQEEQ